jgi:hypothetical protein
MKPFRFSLQAGKGVCGTGVESTTQEKVGQGASPSWGEAKTAVVVDAALLCSQRNAGQVFADADAKWEERIEDEPVVDGVDLDEVEGELEVEESRAGFGGDGLFGYGRSCGFDGRDAQVIEIAPALRMGQEAPYEFDWCVDYGRRTTGVVHDAPWRILRGAMLQWGYMSGVEL